MADPRLSVVIVTYNSVSEIDTCLSSLYAELQGRQADVVVIDNASTDRTAEHVAEHWPQVRLFAEPTNLGFAGANNIGLAAAAGDCILLLNPDTVIQPGAVGQLLSALERHPQAGIVGPKLLNPDGSLQPSCRDFPSLRGDLIGMTELYRLSFIRQLFGKRIVSLGDHSQSRRVDWLSGACLFVRQAAAEPVGKMDEGFFMYSEEMEWQYRMAQRGWEAWYEPAARVTHIGGASTAPLAGRRILWQYRSIWRFYHLYRSRSQRLLLHLVVWAATLPKILVLALISRGSPRRRELLHAFWRVLWLG
ncbi:MAG: glycosyltransferase family 2 protein [Rudaea sp.]